MTTAEAIVAHIAQYEIHARVVEREGVQVVIVESPEDEYIFDVPFNLTVDDAGEAGERILAAVLDFEDREPEVPIN